MLTITRVEFPQEKAALEHLKLNGESNLPSFRAAIVLYSAEGKTVYEIAMIVMKDPMSVRRWINRYNKSGIEGLRSGRSHGRAILYGEKEQTLIGNVASRSPRDFNLNRTFWTLESLTTYLHAQDVPKVSIETVRQILKKKNIRLRRWPIVND